MSDSALDIIERIETQRYRYAANMGVKPKYVVMGMGLVNEMTDGKPLPEEGIMVKIREVYLPILPVGDSENRYLGVC